MSKTTRARYTLEFKLEAGRRELSVADANCRVEAQPVRGPLMRVIATSGPHSKAHAEILGGGANPVAYCARLGLAFAPDVLRATAARMSALNAPESTASPSWMSIARLAFPSRLELKSLAGSINEAPLAKVNFTIDL